MPLGRSLVESEPKRLFSPLPVLYVSAASTASLKGRAHDAAPSYECPVYKYPERTDRYLIFYVKLQTKLRPPSHWTFRGVALLCSTT